MITGNDTAAPEDVGGWREAERARLIAARMAMPAAAHRAASTVIARALEAWFGPSNPGQVGGYWPYRREFDILPTLRHVIELGGEAALPVVIRPRHPLEFRRWTPQVRMKPGVLGIPYPVDGPPLHPTMLLVPLVGFDSRGFRLGYGAGFYDRTLAAFPHRPVTIGIGFELARLETIHPQPHDVPLDWLVTEAGIERAGG